MAKVLISYGRLNVPQDGDGKPMLDRHILSTVLEVESCLELLGHRVAKAALSRNPTRFLKTYFELRPEVIFNLCEEVDADPRKEKSAAAFFELLSVPFTGNGTLPLAVCQDKAMTKRVLMASGIHTSPFRVVSNPEDAEIPFKFPAIVKPVREDGSRGITARSVVRNRKSLAARIRYVRRNFRQPALVERYISGREFMVSLLGNRDPEILAVAELSYEGLPRRLPWIVTYSAKWEKRSRYYKFTNPIVPADVERSIEKKLRAISLKIFGIFNLRGYARVDFRLREDRPYVIDVNPNPDISSDAGFAKAARYAGLSYDEMVNRLVELALEQKYD